MTRVLALTPYPPRRDGRHGGSRAMAASLLALAGAHELGLLYLRRPGEPEADPALAARAALTVAVPHPERADGGAALLRARAAELAGTLTGTPAWVGWTASPALARETRALAAAFRPDVVQFEQHVMAQFAASLPVRGPARVLVVHEPGAASAHEQRLAASGARAALRSLDARAWARWERRALAGMDGLVAFTEDDRATLGRYGLQVPVAVVPLPVEVPPEAASHAGTEPHTLLFVGDYAHPPNAAAAEVLLGDILPRVRRDLADAALVLVGQHAGPARRPLHPRSDGHRPGRRRPPLPGARRARARAAVERRRDAGEGAARARRGQGRRRHRRARSPASACATARRSPSRTRPRPSPRPSPACSATPARAPRWAPPPAAGRSRSPPAPATPTATSRSGTPLSPAAGTGGA